MSDKFVFLSKKNLDKINAWVEQNEYHVLGEAYNGVCYAIGSYNNSKITDFFQNSYKGKKLLRWYYFFRKSNDILDNLYIARDSIGREILKIIKKEETLKVD